MNFPRCQRLFFGWIFFVLCSAGKALAQQGPDLTTTNLALINTANNYNLGPTGLRGWIYVARDNRVDPAGNGYSRGVDESMTDCQPYQVLVTTIGTNTPASGVMQTNDVLLGVSTGAGNLPVPLFTNDTRKAIGLAIGAAEAGDGWMNFKVWRAGVTNNVSIRLSLQGLAYSATAPYNCPKSAVILSNAVNVLAQRSLNYSSLGNQIVGLAMLASGNTNFAPTLQSYAQSIPAPNPGDWFWDIGYRGVFLSEYYLKTGDTNVLSRLASLALYCANGSDRYGTMCHGPGFNNADGSPNGTAGGYGPVNAVGVTANLAMVLAQKCLVAAGQPVNPAIPAAITRGTNLFGWYVQKGEIQYGEHLPWGAGSHASNGKHGGAALLFAMTGNRPVETEYWTRMTLAGYLGREYGHTGQGLSYIWESLGANVGGTNALVAYISNIKWHLDLERRSDGSFVYDGAEQYGPSPVSDYWTVGGNNTYAGEDPTAYYVLTYALPLQQILLTGKNANPTNFLSAAKITNAIWAATIPTSISQMTTNQLIAALSEFDPNVRCWSALELGNRTNVSVATITNLAANSNAWTRAAACVVLGEMLNTNGFPALVQRLTDTDISVRAHAAIALKKCGAAITNYIPAMLMAYTNNATDPAVINWNDPWQGANEVLASVLWGGWLLTGGVGNDNLVPYTASANRALLYPALRAGLKHPDSLSRGDAANFINSRLSLVDIQTLVLDLVECATTPVLADPMWRTDGRGNSIKALGKYYGAEAVPVAMAMLNPPWNALGQGDAPENNSPNDALSVIANYRDSVRYLLPTFNSYVTSWGASDGRFNTLVTVINTISTATNSPTITNLFPVANSKVVNTTNAMVIALTGFSCRTNTVTFQNLTAPAHGTLTGTAPNLTYTPTNGYVGLDRFTFQVADSLTNSSPATVSLIVGNPAGAGVKGKYYDNADLTNLKFTRIDPQINFDWGTGTPSNTIAAGTYSVHWTGLLLVPESGNYQFATLNSDGVRVFINGSPVLDDWATHDRHWNDGASLALTAGQKYIVEMDYYKNTGSSVAKLKWTGPSFAGSNGLIIASAWLFDATGVTNLPLFAYAQSLTMLANTNQTIQLAGSPSATNFAIATGPANGNLTGTPPTVTYTPNANFSGADSFTFTAGDVVSNSAPATVTINVLAGAPVTFAWMNSADGLWSVAGNWTNSAGGSLAPAASGQPFYIINFNPTGTYTVTNDLNASFLANQMNFAGNVTVTGNAIAFTNNGATLPQFMQTSGNAVTMDAPLTLGATTTLGGNGSGRVTINSLISGPGGWVINSPAQLWLSNPTNTYAGGTVINAGTVVCPTGNGNPTPIFGTGSITLNASATLSVDRSYFTNRLAWNGGTVSGGNSFSSFFAGPVTLTGIGTFDLGTSGGFEISGNTDGAGGLLTTGTTNPKLSGTNTFTGPTIIQSGSFNYTKTVAVAPGMLSISNGASANLNYTGTATNNWLFLGGVPQPAGTYGSLTSGATNKSSYFSSAGILTVVPSLGSITNQPATDVTTNAATLNASFTGSGVAGTVIVYWGTTNAGSNAAAWANSAVIGAWNLLGATNLNCAVTGLTNTAQYFFTFRATNSLLDVWATPLQSFVTTVPGANAYLANLTPSVSALTPAFGVFTYNYSATVSYTTTNLALTPTAFDTNATIRVNGNVVPSGATSPTNSLALGANVINTAVVSANGAVTNTYALTVTRIAASTNALLANLVPSAGALAPTFASNVFNYTNNVTFAVTSLAVTPTAADATATIRVNGAVVSSGTPSATTNLIIGATLFNVTVISESQTVTNTYTLTVNRAASLVRWWDGGAADIATNGDAVSAGGSGTWNATLQNWDQGSLTPHGPWDNTGTNLAFFGGAAGTITNLGVTVGGLIFTNAYTVTNGTITFAAAGMISNSAAVTLASDLAGSGPITKDGAGTLTVRGTNTYTGGTIINAGTVNISATNGLGASGTAVTFNGSATLILAANLTNDHPVVLNSAIMSLQNTPTGSGSLFSGAVTGSGGITMVTGNGGSATTITLASTTNAFTGNLTLATGANNDFFAFASIGDGGQLILGKAGWRGVAQYTGTPNLIFTNRQLALTSAFGGTLDGNGNPINAVQVNGAGTLRFNTNLSVAATITSGTFYFDGSNAGDNTFAGVIPKPATSGTLAIGKWGTGRWLLTGSNTFDGLVLVAQGTLAVNAIFPSTNAQPLGKGSLIQLGQNAINGTLEYTGATAATADRQIQLGNTTANQTGAGSILNNGAGPLTFSAATFNPTIAGITGTRILTLGGSFNGSNEIQGVIQNSTNTGVVNLFVTGSIWKLSGTNTYTGPTIVTNGTLLYNGSLAAGTNAVIVTNSGTLGGSGVILRPITVASGATLAPGDGLGTLTVTNLTLASNSTYRVELSGASADQVVASGTVSVTNAILNLTNLTAVSGSYTILRKTSAGAIAGTFTNWLEGATNVVNGITYKITYAGNGSNDIVLTAAAPPLASFTAAPTNGYAPLRVVFTDVSTGTITNRQWNFGDGNAFTNAAPTLVTNLYANAGSYAVTLIVRGPLGSSTNIRSGYITVADVPPPTLTGASGFSISPAGAVSASFTALAGVQYRLVQKTNLQSGSSWIAVTPPFPNGWTNGNNAAIELTDPTSVGASQRFYRLEAKSVSAP